MGISHRVVVHRISAAPLHMTGQPGNTPGYEPHAAEDAGSFRSLNTGARINNRYLGTYVGPNLHSIFPHGEYCYGILLDQRSAPAKAPHFVVIRPLSLVPLVLKPHACICECGMRRAGPHSGDQ